MVIKMFDWDLYDDFCMHFLYVLLFFLLLLFFFINCLFAIFAKSLSVCLQTKLLWVRLLLQQLNLQIWCLASSRRFLDIQTSIEFVFSLNRILDKIRTYKQMHCKDNYSQ